MDDYPRPQETLRRVLAQEVRRGRIDYHRTSRRYGLDLETREALRALTLDP
jgi:hypothetical protein